METPINERQGGRVLRIDFFRGIVLVIALIDHVEHLNGLRRLAAWTPQSLGLSDVAEGFVFLSGYAFALVQERRLREGGLGKSLVFAVRRSFQIYNAYLAALFAVLAIELAVGDASPRLAEELHSSSPLSVQIWGALTMANHPYGLGILPLYALVLPYAAIMAWLFRRCAPLAVSISLGLYAFAQCFPAVNLRATYQSEWFFNPLAWQLLFLFGAWTAQRGALPSRTAKFLTPIAVAVVVSALFYDKGSDFWSARIALPRSVSTTSWGDLSISHLEEYARKTTLGPARIVHFASVAWLLSRIVRSDAAMTDWPCRWFVAIGQRSLCFYTLGSVLALLSIPVIQIAGASHLSLVLVHLDVLIGAYLLTGWCKRTTLSASASYVPTDPPKAA